MPLNNKLLLASSLFLLLASSLFLTGTFAFPFSKNATRTIFARDPVNFPKIASVFTATQTQQIMDGFNDALELASYVRVSLPETVDPIFAKYFLPEDRDAVNGKQKSKDAPKPTSNAPLTPNPGVFDVILGGDPMDPPGNALLKDLTISPDFLNPNTGEYTCDDPKTQGSTRGYDSDNPVTILCDPQTFGHGGIAKSYDNGEIPEVNCDTLEERVSWDMDTVGATLLHEYTHFAKLMTSNNPGPLPHSTNDHADGIYNVRNLKDPSQAVDNADSYAWFATEVLWTVLCSKKYGDPTVPDGEDPNCDNSSCQDSDEDDP